MACGARAPVYSPAALSSQLPALPRTIPLTHAIPEPSRLPPIVLCQALYKFPAQQLTANSVGPSCGASSPPNSVEMARWRWLWREESGMGALSREWIGGGKRSRGFHFRFHTAVPLQLMPLPPLTLALLRPAPRPPDTKAAPAPALTMAPLPPSLYGLAALRFLPCSPPQFPPSFS